MSRILSVTLIATSIVLMHALPSAAAKPGGGGGGGATQTVTSTLHAGPALAPHTIRGDSSPSATYYHGLDSVVSQLPDYYELSALASPNRRMFIDLSNPVDTAEWIPEVEPSVVPQGALGGATSGLVKGRFIDRQKGTAAMTELGSTLTHGFAFVFTGADGATYQVRMNSALEPLTDNATITCEAVDSSNACVAWHAVPAGEGGTNIARLARVVTVRGKEQLTYYGFFYMTFDVTFTKP